MKITNYLLLIFTILFSINTFAADTRILDLDEIEDCQKYINADSKSVDAEMIIYCEIAQKTTMSLSDNVNKNEDGEMNFTNSLFAMFNSMNVEPKPIKDLRDTLFTIVIIFTFLYILIYTLMKNNDRGDRFKNVLFQQGTLLRIFLISMFSFLNLFVLAAFAISHILYSSIIRQANEAEAIIMDESPLENLNMNNKVKVVSDKVAMSFVKSVISESFEYNSRVIEHYTDEVDIQDLLDSSELNSCIQEKKKSYSFESSKMSEDSYTISECQKQYGNGLIPVRFKGRVYSDTEQTFNELYKLTKEFSVSLMQYICYSENVGFYNESNENINFYVGARNHAACMDYRPIVNDDKGEVIQHGNELTYRDLVKLEEKYLSDFFLIFNTYSKTFDIDNQDVFTNEVDLEDMRKNPITYFINSRFLPVKQIKSFTNENSYQLTKANDFSLAEPLFFGQQTNAKAMWENFNLFEIRDKAMTAFNQAVFTANKESSVLDGLDVNDLYVVKKFLVRCDDIEREKCNTVVNVVPYLTSIFMAQGLGFGLTYGTLESINLSTQKLVDKNMLSQAKAASFLRYINYLKSKSLIMFKFSMFGMLSILAFGLFMIIRLLKSVLEIILAFYMAFINITLNTTDYLFKDLINKTINPATIILSFLVSNIAITVGICLLFDSFDIVMNIRSLKLIIFANSYTYMYLFGYVPLMILCMYLSTQVIFRLTGLQTSNTMQESKQMLGSFKKNMRTGF
ncbi:hypothetical protein L7E35_004645 [Vibrio parahaemolyticus]|nr:hypothetical protein [Vibrio parahaemolyticus]EIV1599699.1 hypothetical protein [Vibrio parahaemolyticus]